MAVVWGFWIFLLAPGFAGLSHVNRPGFWAGHLAVQLWWYLFFLMQGIFLCKVL